MIKNILNYYKESLLLDTLLKMEIKEEELFYGDKNIPSDFVYLTYGISNFFAKDKFVFFVNSAIEKFEEKNRLAQERNYVQEDFPYEFTYAPFPIKKTIYNANNQKDTFIYPIFLLTISYDKILYFIKNIHSNENKFKNYRFFENSMVFHPFAIEEGLNCVKEKYFVKFMSELKEQSMNNAVPTFEHLLYKLLTFVNTFTNSELIYNSEDERTIYEMSIELIKALQTYYRTEGKNIYENIEVFKEPWIIVKKQEELNFTRGLLNVYTSIDQHGIKENNLLYTILKGNKYKTTAIPYEEEVDDKSTIILDRNLIIDALKKQKGAFAKDFDLTYSQKYALVMSKLNFDTTPVNGPPGTGKTSLLRALIGDITVENALKVYEFYLLKKKELPFSTPIVSFSTNNKALENIVEGVNEAFLSTYQIAKEENSEKAILYKRWINLSFAYFNPNRGHKGERVETSINEAKLYVPFIKNGKSYDGSNPKAPLYFFNLKDKFGLKRFIVELNRNIFNYLEKWLVNYAVFIHSEKLPVKSVNAIPPLKLLDIAINDLAERLHQNINIKNGAIEDFRQTILSKKECFPDIKEVYECLNLELTFQEILNKEDFNSQLFIIKNHVDFLNHTVNLMNTNTEGKKEDYKTKNQILKAELINKITFYNFEADKEIQVVAEKEKNINNALSLEYNNNIEKLQKNIMEIEESIKNSFWARIKNFLAKKLNIEKLMDERILELEATIITFKDAFKKEEQKAKKSLANKIINIEKMRAQKIKAVKDAISIKEKNLLNNFKASLKNYEDDFLKFTGGTSKNDIIDKITRATEFVKEMEKADYFFIDEFEKEFIDTFKNFDKTIHTDNFFIASHLLEALLFKELLRVSNISNKAENECFACGKKTLVRQQNKEKEFYRCKACRACFVNNKIKSLERPLNAKELKQILTNGYVKINDETFTLTKGKEPFWNIRSIVFAKNLDNSEKHFRYCSVFFPIVNTTCHSFGSVFNIGSENSIPSSFIDTLFMDESGMILAPFLVNLYAGKKVILFGDEKQIEPVYPFGEHSDICNRILIDIYAKDEEEKDIMRNKMNVLERTSMSLANDASYFKNPYTKNTLPGDLWLKEHFRCRNSIIEFCNKHIYDGYMIPLKENDKEKKHLYACNHSYTQKNITGGGRTNEEEALLIIEKIKKIVEKRLKTNSETTTEEICKNIGIITPYKEQESLFRHILRRERRLQGIVAGTVHKFQGSEREIIFFSSTIGLNTQNVGRLFFNQDNFNILNVAVSRAKETFILCGNIDRINDAPMSYIGLLGAHINKYGGNI